MTEKRNGIKKISWIRNLAVFKNFNWDESFPGSKDGIFFTKINIIYGRNYAGKTSLSRIFRAMEIGELPDTLREASFCVEFHDGTDATKNNLSGHGKHIRVFNEDFVRENLRFIANPDESVVPFAILGRRNNEVEKEIESLQSELSGLRDDHAQFDEAYKSANTEYTKAKRELDNKLTEKAKKIKYEADRFGDRVYDVRKLRKDIDAVSEAVYQPLSQPQKDTCEKLIQEKILNAVSAPQLHTLQFQELSDKARALVTQEISEANKIEELVKDTVLNQWVKEGYSLHEDKRNLCAFCDNQISTKRWAQLRNHFDEEVKKLEEDIHGLIHEIKHERELVSSIELADKSSFYSRFHNNIDEINLESAIEGYLSSLDQLIDQLDKKQGDKINYTEFCQPIDASKELENTLSAYARICKEAKEYADSLGSDQSEAKKALRLNHVADYLSDIQYESARAAINGFEKTRSDADSKKVRIEKLIRQKEKLVSCKQKQLSDEGQGAQEINRYLSGIGANFLLETQEDQIEGQGKRTKFEVTRDGEKARNLSEGERSLLAFCYFIAKLKGTNPSNSQPVIWIDDPVSSLDGNHIFFIYSLIASDIVHHQEFEQLVISTHNLEFLRQFRRLRHPHKLYLTLERDGQTSIINMMPNYLKEYATEFNYLFNQIHRCAHEEISNENDAIFHNFGNNARKFLEIYLYYKYPDPDQSEGDGNLQLFFDNDMIPAILTSRIGNERSHASTTFEGSALPVEEIKIVANQILKRIAELDPAQYKALCTSVGQEAD